MTTPYMSQFVQVSGPMESADPSNLEIDGRAGLHRGMLRVIEVNPEAEPRWDSFVSAHPDGLIYHCADYLRILAQEYGSRTIFLACEDESGRLRGILPLFHTRGFPFQKGELFGRRLTSLPRTPIAGPLALDREALIVLLKAAKERANREKGTMLQLKVPASIENNLVEDLVCIPWRMTYVIELPDRPEKLRFGNSRNHTRIRQRVTKAAKLGVNIRFAETEQDLKEWYELYLETMRWHAVPPRPYRLFSGFWKYLGKDKMRLLLAEQVTENGSKLLAGSIFLMYGKTVFYAFNGRRGEELAKLPNYAILWKAIFDACKQGFRYFDLGEVTGDTAGLAEFKGKWAGKPRWLHRYYYPMPKEVPKREAESKGIAIPYLEAIWRRVPLRVTAFVGNFVYGFL